MHLLDISLKCAVCSLEFSRYKIYTYICIKIRSVFTAVLTNTTYKEGGLLHKGFERCIRMQEKRAREIENWDRRDDDNKRLFLPTNVIINIRSQRREFSLFKEMMTYLEHKQ